ncbi:hypothetical protein [Halorubrum trueperi]|uniref:LPXTG cell wall anchor domain-containing protein n=1 Tax=Halorubrum trueperi TaxID=2004704 RepID=A0ABD5URD3_9EURY
MTTIDINGLTKHNGDVEFTMGSGLFLAGTAVGVVYAYVRARRRSA